jgi:hypothetical protein
LLYGAHFDARNSDLGLKNTFYWDMSYEYPDIYRGPTPGPQNGMSGAGNDQIFAESYGEMTVLIDDGEIAQGTGEKGDLASGGS